MKAALSFFMLLALACSGAQTEYENQGTFCDFAYSDGTLSFTVDFHVCQSSSCDEELSKNCTVRLEENRLIVDASIVIESESGSCTDDCVFSAVSCAVPSLPEGTYSIAFAGDGQQTIELEVPPVAEQRCF